MITKTGRVRKPNQESRAALKEDRAEETEEARSDGLVPVPGLALPERAADPSGTRVGSVNDPAEAEAEATARSIVEVLRTTNPIADPVTGSENHAGAAGGDTVRRAAVVGAEGDVLDGATAGAVGELRGTGRPLPAPVRHGMEAAFGADLSDVRVHTGGTATQLNDALQSQAFTAGRDIAFADGMPDTTTAEGQHLLAHELTHVLQNRDGSPIRRTLKKKGAKADTSWDDLQLEPDLADATAVARLVIRFWATSSSVSITYTTVSALANRASKAFLELDEDFADSLQTLAEIKEVEDSLSRRKKKNPDLEEAVAERKQELQQAFSKQLGSGYSLPKPHADSRYKTPSGMLSTVADTGGRENGAWVTVNNPMAGLAGKTTGSVNLALLEEARHQGSVFSVGSRHEQICATCGKPTDAALFEVDHQQAFSDIRDKLHLLASAMTGDKQLYQSMVSNTADFKKIFQVTGKPGHKSFNVEALASGVHMYSNDLDNLMRICRLCNGPWGKSDMDMVDWYKTSPLYGQQFLDSYGLPGTTQVILRTRKNLGWGFAAREWFVKHHLPVLKDLKLTSNIQEVVRQRLIGQSNLNIQAQLTTDPVKQQQLRAETDQHGRNNQAMLGGLQSMHEYHTGKPSNFSPGSPQRIEKEYGEVHQRREKRKRTEDMKGNKAYAVGLADGRANKPVHQANYPINSDDREAYDQGYLEGKEEYQGIEREGELAALDWDLDYPDPDPDGSHPFQYHWGHDQMLKRRRQARQAGFDAASQDTGLDTGYATGQPHSERLLRDYLAGYQAAQQQAKQRQVRNDQQNVFSQPSVPSPQHGFGNGSFSGMVPKQTVPQHRPDQQAFQFLPPTQPVVSTTPSFAPLRQLPPPPIPTGPYGMPGQYQQLPPQHGQHSQQPVAPQHQLPGQHLPQYGQPAQLQQHQQLLQALHQQHLRMQQLQPPQGGHLQNQNDQYGQNMQQFGQGLQNFGNNVQQYGQNLQQGQNQQLPPWDWWKHFGSS